MNFDQIKADLANGSYDFCIIGSEGGSFDHLTVKHKSKVSEHEQAHILTVNNKQFFYTKEQCQALIEALQMADVADPEDDEDDEPLRLCYNSERMWSRWFTWKDLPEGWFPGLINGNPIIAHKQKRIKIVDAIWTSINLIELSLAKEINYPLIDYIY